MKEVVVIGNKPYSNLLLDNILDGFESNHRCNMSLPNNNNGTIYDNLGLCLHLYENLITKKLNEDSFRREYGGEYMENEINRFLSNFDRSKYKNIYYADNFKKNTDRFNNLLSRYKSPHRFNKMPRTGYTIMFESLLREDRVFVSNFSIYDEERKTYYVKKEKYENHHCHSKEDEILILNWLHSNGKIDASLCLLEDLEIPTFNCRKLIPTPFIIDKIIREYGKCRFSNLSNPNILENYTYKKEDELFCIYK